MNFTTAVRTCLKKYSTFSGVAARSEYWYFILFVGLGNLLFSISALLLLRIIWGLAFLLPNLAVTVRRLHDTGRSAWWLLTAFILPWFIVLMCLSDEMTNSKYAGDRIDSPSRPLVTEENVTTSNTHCLSCYKLRLPGQTYCAGCGAKFTQD